MAVTRAAACFLAALMVGRLTAEKTPEVRHWLSATDALPSAADWSFAGYQGEAKAWAGQTYWAGLLRCGKGLLHPLNFRSLLLAGLYAGGDTTLPYPSIAYDVVRDFKARGDGQADDTAALQVSLPGSSCCFMRIESDEPIKPQPFAS